MDFKRRSEIGENHLLGLPIGIEVTLHSQQPRQMKQKAKIKSCLAFCELDELKQCISIGNGTIEVECNNLFHLSNLTIEYENKRQYPTYDTELYKAVFHQHLSGTSTL